MSAAQSAQRVVDLNSDLGESYGRWVLGDDSAMLDIVTSANVACGFHAGDPATLRRTCALAAERGVVIGAQVSYPDLPGFGRRFLDMEPGDLTDAVLYQIGALEAMARVAGARVGYVKPHGALYHRCADDEVHAAAVVEAVAAYDARLPVVGLAASSLHECANSSGVAFVREAFADRAYTSEGRLLARSEPGAVLDDPPEVARRAVDMVTRGKVTAVDGMLLDVHVDSICVHGDSPDALVMARHIRDALELAGVQLRAFVA